MIVNRLSYVNSENKEINLLNGNIRALKTSDIFSHEWEKKETSNNLVSSFQMQDVSKTLDLVCKASTKEEANKSLEQLYRAYEKDLIDEKDGLLYFGDYYLRCSINKESYADWDAYRKIQRVQLGITSRTGLWYKDVSKVFGIRESSASDGKDYPYDFPYNYADDSMKNRLKTDSISDTDFRLEISGIANNPTIRIGGHTYRVFASADAGESIIIDSREKTVVKKDKYGISTNIFYLRDKDHYIFRKLRTRDGMTSVEFEEPLVFKLTAYVERSRPLWI